MQNAYAQRIIGVNLSPLAHAPLVDRCACRRAHDISKHRFSMSQAVQKWALKSQIINNSMVRDTELRVAAIRPQIKIHVKLSRRCGCSFGDCLGAVE